MVQSVSVGRAVVGQPPPAVPAVAPTCDVVAADGAVGHGQVGRAGIEHAAGGRRRSRSMVRRAELPLMVQSVSVAVP